MKKAMLVHLNELDFYLKKIDAVWPVRCLTGEAIDCEKVVDYYRQSRIVYKYVHSYSGAMHMAVNPDGVFNAKGFYTSLNEIVEIISPLPAGAVLELGCGKGFNSAYLAKKIPHAHFTGIDVSGEHLAIARKKASRIHNLSILYGDFQDIMFPDGAFDTVFELESICHARKVRQVLSEVFRVLKKGGRFIVYDGFRQSGFHRLPDRLIEAARMTEKALAVDHFEDIDGWLAMAVAEGFRIHEKKDLSASIMPNLARLQYLARRYFEYPMLTKLLLRLLNVYTMRNCIAVLLMPFTLHNNAHGYYKIILEK